MHCIDPFYAKKVKMIDLRGLVPLTFYQSVHTRTLTIHYNFSSNILIFDLISRVSQLNYRKEEEYNGKVYNYVNINTFFSLVFIPVDVNSLQCIIISL